MKKIIIYGHGGSGNHGCEALAKTIYDLLPLNCLKILCSLNVEEDCFYKTANLFDFVIKQESFTKGSFLYYIDGILRKVFKNKGIALKRTFKSLEKEISKGDIAISIGGDNYCYNNTLWLEKYNKFFKSKNIKTILMGCSIEPLSLNNKNIVNDLREYSLIIARESITYNALTEIGLENVYLIPDTAFTLRTTECTLPQGFIENNTVGINLSPLVESLETIDNLALKNYEILIKKIIDNTKMQIALIPHVVWKRDNDIAVLNILYEKFKNSNRVIFVNDHNCNEIKYIISKCRFFIAARTHASIAAYSTGVPTLVLGYSVKAKGIAHDIFDDTENYVVPVQDLKNEEDLFNAFNWIYENENLIKKRLEEKIPNYLLEIKRLNNLIEESLFYDKFKTKE